MPHRAIIGQTGSGKTHGAKEIAAEMRRAGIGTLVLHKPREPWSRDCASWQTDNPARFLRMFWASRQCGCFMELADADVSKWDHSFHLCFTQGRHEGHRCFYLSQRAAQVHPNIRDNCESLMLFSVNNSGAKLWSDEFNDQTLLGAVNLKPRMYYFKPSRWEPARLMQLSA